MKKLFLNSHFIYKPLIYLLVFFSSQTILAQGGMWTWLNGDSVSAALGVFGTQGIPSINNHPPGLYECSEWKDMEGNFWLHGGFNPSYSDLWKYDPKTNEWTWVKGNGIIGQLPVYGIKGMSDAANTPGQRTYVSISWVDTAGNFWLFGGDEFRNDLWQYQISNNEWTWMSGDTIKNSQGVHGTQGIPSILNIPGARCETSSGWVDSLNNLWLFGGIGYDDNGNYGNLNDLWKYNIATNEWTWMKGSADTNTVGYYGIKGFPNALNNPGGRYSHTKWKDTNGDFWIMGGGYPYFYNDVWKYELNTNEWTWVVGSNTINDSGQYFSMCSNDTINYPCSRTEQRSSVTDKCGKFWMFGGFKNNTYERVSDLWIFDPTLDTWNWLSGTTNPNLGSYGIKGIPSNNNTPPSRCGAIAWWGNDNRFYIFGGNQAGTFNNFNDVWVFTPDTICSDCQSVPFTAFATSTYICPGTCNNFTNFSIYADSYHWSFPNAAPDTSTATNPSNICYTIPGTYDVQLIASNANGSDTLLLTNYITVFPSPPAQSITQSGDTLSAIAGSASYQWYFNGTIINGATNYFYVATQSGDYNVVATDTNGCEVEAVINDVLASAQLAVGNWQFAIYPNPVIDELTIRNLQVKSGTAETISIYNLIGEKVLAVQLPTVPKLQDQLPTCSIDVSVLLPGMYWLDFSAEGKTFRAKFVKSSFR